MIMLIVLVLPMQCSVAYGSKAVGPFNKFSLEA